MTWPPASSRIAFVAVAFAATLPFAGSLGHGFALDDSVEVVRNAHASSLANLPELFTRSAWEGAGEVAPIYRPLTSATYALNHDLFGPAPWSYHALNVLLHVLASLLVLALARRLGLGHLAAAASAVLFAVHPVHVEVVANVAGRKDALATAFTLATVLLHARGLRERRGWPWLALAGASYAGALLAKESGAVAFPLALAWTVVVDREPWRTGRGRVLGAAALYAGVLALYLLARWAAIGALGVPLGQIPYVENPLPHVDAATRFLTAVAVLGRGLWMLVFPRTLSPDWSYQAIPLVRSPIDAGFILSVAAIAAIAVAGWRARKSHPALAYLVVWYGGGAFLTSNLAVRVGTIFGERLLYLPSVAFCIGTVWIVKLAAERVEPGGVRVGVGRLVPAVGTLLLLVLAAKSWAYAATWRDEVTLFSEAVRRVPGSAKAHLLLGAAYMEVGRVEDGVAALEAGVARLPDAPYDPGAHVQLGVAYERAGRITEAEALYLGVLERAPDHPDTLWRLGVVRWLQNLRPDAERLWQRVLLLDPAHARAMTDLGLLLEARGDRAGAEAHWTRAAQLDPLLAGPWLHLGESRLSRGDVAGARDAWLRFLELARYGVHPGQREAVEARLRALDGR